MKDLTLIIMAAGLGSRYGGLKQLDSISKNGEFIVDYSVFDAIKAGFNKVIFVIKRENFELFKSTIGVRFADKIKVEYAFQDMEDVLFPVDISARKKPWGTGHAVLSCRNLVHENFAVINADDFYGRESFYLLSDFLQKDAVQKSYCMVAFILQNTLTENGYVARGVCEVAPDNSLKKVVEHTKIMWDNEKIVSIDTQNNKTILQNNAIVSMNCWGFTPTVFEELQDNFVKFLQENQKDLSTVEYFLPYVIDEQIQKNKCTVTVKSTAERWFGMTYKQDKLAVENHIKSLIEQKIYPEGLWK